MPLDHSCYPLLPEGVREFGVDAWLEAYDSPVTSDLFQTIYDYLLESFIKLLPEDRMDPVYATAISNYKLLFYLAHNCFFQIRFTKLAEQGIKTVYGQKQKTIEQAVKALSADFFADEADMDFGLDFVNYGRYHWRIIRTNWGHVSPLNALFPKRANSAFYSVGGRTVKELKTYAAAMGDSPVTLQPRTFYPSSQLNIPKTDLARLEHFIDTLLLSIKERFPDASVFIDDRFRELTMLYYTRAMNAVLQCRRRVVGWPPKPVLVTGIGNIHHRIFSMAWQTIGGKIANFTHGNSYCLAYKPGSITTGSHAIVDNYIASSEGEAELLRDAARDFRNGLPAFAEVSVNPFNVYRPIHDSYSDMKSVTTVKKVMLVGYPMSYHYHLYHPEQSALTHLHLELSLIKQLKQHGFAVVYKAHPDTFDSIQCIYDQYVDKIIPEPFEQVCHEGLADCALFGSPSTTTFGYVLLTKLPVVVVDIKGTWWHPAVKPLAERRCSFVEAHTDGHGRVVFDGNELVSAVNDSVNKTDMEIVNRYALR